MTIAEMPVVIAGGGPAGLAASVISDSSAARPSAAHPSGIRRIRAAQLALGVLLALAVAGAPAVAHAAAPSTRHLQHPSLSAHVAHKLNRALLRSWSTTWPPGVIAGVWMGNRRWTTAVGSTRRALGPNPLLKDHTRIGSDTKTIVGTIILRLVDQGRLSLNDSIARWFPQIPDATNITIRDLGEMSSGIPSYTADNALTNQYFADPRQTFSPNVLNAAGAAQPQMFPPGHGFWYSDTNFVILGRIIEMVTGNPLAQVMRQMVFKPLGMRNSLFPTNNQIPKPFLRGYTAQGSMFGNALDSTHWTPSFAAGAGGAISTLGDLHRLAVAVGTGKLLKPATQRVRLIPNPASEGGGRAYLFALGRDHGWLVHQGQIPGYNTEIAYLPKLKAALVVIANSDIANAQKVNPVSAIFTALARVISPRNVPTGTS